MITLDFESDAIEPYPDFPPRPVGLAVKYGDQPSAYLAWGHPTNNNCTKEAAALIIDEVFKSGEPLLFQNARFDMAVFMKFFPEQVPSWGDPLRIHDTMFLIFLDDPLQDTFSLKPTAERLLGLPPDEQDAVRDWLVAHGIAPSNSKSWGKDIGKAPGDLVGTYAAGDTDRTKQLYDLLLPRIVARGMGPAYDRERELAPILSQSEKDGLRINMKELEEDIELYSKAFGSISLAIKGKLGHEYNEEFNMDSGPQLAAAARLAGFTVGEDDWPKTPTGKLSTARDVLKQVLTDEALYQMLSYRGALKTLLGTFMRSWYEKGLATGGRLHPGWNQVKGVDYGAKTGRLSSSNPNFQNIPNEFDEQPPEGYPELPLMRKYVLPDDSDSYFVSADFQSQEIRMLGHFAEGAIQEIYCSDPNADLHQVAADIISDQTGMTITRKHTKITAFSILYGAGVGTMASRLGIPVNEAGQIKRAYLKTLVGVKEFMQDVESRAALRVPVRTWGGRELFAPAPVIQADGRVWNKDYVLLNYLIQGSSADQTKQAIIDYDRTRVHGRFLATVHDEICISVPKQHLVTEVLLLKAAMEGGEFDIPMRATIDYGDCWSQLKEM